MRIVKSLNDKGLITPPLWLPGNVHYETIMGSYAYGVSEDTSDCDVYGFCIPPPEVIFPHLKGFIRGFGEQAEDFEQYQKHHIKDEAEGQEYDLQIYNITKYFNLCMGCNPNMIDSLFTPKAAVLYTSSIAERVMKNRHMFLSKKAWTTFKGYAYGQIQKLANKHPTGHRYYLVEKYGYDVKYAYHLVRIMDEAEQILENHDIDVTRDKERLRAIRHGKWTEAQVLDFFKSKTRELEDVYKKSTLREEPDEKAIYKLLCECLEEAYAYAPGSLGKNRY